MNSNLKITEEIAADIRARVKSFDFTAIEKIVKAKDQNGTFDVIISTEDTDRAGEIVKQSGWELANYKNNPIVLWGHDYHSMPIGACTETYLTEQNGIPALGARGVFLSADINPFAQQVRKLYEFGLGKGAGVGCTTSVGFISKEFDENARNTITKAELLEFSFVPVPANQGVGPAQGRALTFTEAKQIGLDVERMTRKGLEFIDKVECKGVGICEDGECDHNGTAKAAEAGDSCTMEDGSDGQLAADPKDPDGPLVCIPAEAKALTDETGSQKKLLKAVGEEQDRHTDAIDKALDAFQIEMPEGDDAKKAADATRENLKDLRDALRDEHVMHRARSVASFRGFEAVEDKAFDKNTHLKALRAQHDEYEANNTKALDEFEEKCAKGAQGDEERDSLTDGFTAKLEENQRAHKKAVAKIAKGMCKAAFGEEDEADEKTIAILKEFLTPHVDPQLLTALTAKIGTAISANTKKKLGEAHQHLKSASAILEALHPGLAGGDGDETPAESDKTVVPAPVVRSKPRATVRAEDELSAHLQTRETLRGIESVVREGLANLNIKVRTLQK